MSKLIRQLFCHHRYDDSFSVLFSCESNQYKTFHIYTCCRCGCKKKLYIELED